MKLVIQPVLQGQIADVNMMTHLEKGMSGVSPEQLLRPSWFYRLCNDSLYILKNKNASSLFSIIYQTG